MEELKEYICRNVVSDILILDECFAVLASDTASGASISLVQPRMVPLTSLGRAPL